MILRLLALQWILISPVLKPSCMQCFNGLHVAIGSNPFPSNFVS